MNPGEIDAGKLDIHGKQGFRIRRNFWWTVNGAVAPLTGAVVTIRVADDYRTADDQSVVLSGSSDGDDLIFTIDIDTGLIALNIPGSVTEGIAPGTYVYDIVVTIDGEPIPFVEGRFVIRPRV